MIKPLYFISGANYDDEKFPIVNIYKLCVIGKESPSYIFIGVNNDGGIGTATDDHAKSEREAILRVLPYGEDISTLVEGDFDHVLDVVNETITKLSEIKPKF